MGEVKVADVLTVVNTGTVPGIGISQVEIDVLAEVITQVLAKIAPNTKKGTFILDGHVYDEKVTCILRANLSEGTFRRNYFRIYDRKSDDLACESIDEILNWHDSGKSCYARYLDRESSYIPSQFYRNGEHAVLVLNMQRGCLYFSCHLDDQDYDQQSSYLDEDISYIVATTLRILLPDDAVLRESVEHLPVQLPSDHRLDDAVRLVQDLFNQGTLPSIAVWKVKRQ